ncbi:MAG TPA: 30S ribosomal protein S3 [Candidatus Woesearchaeota archaeon]|nr:30S ribosomal protein S3 [Candidatus Woesearchaeota archaeon]
MIERTFVKNNVNLFRIREYIFNKFPNAGISSVEVKRTPLGEKVILSSSMPGLVVGRKGKNIVSLSDELKEKFGLENPEIEVLEVENPFLDAKIMAEGIVVSLQRFGPNGFKSAMHKTIDKIMRAGARGVEVVLSGKIPGARARTWRVSKGYLKKCGNPAQTLVKKNISVASLKAGIIGVVVKILPPGVNLPDDVSIKQKSEGEAK